MTMYRRVAVLVLGLFAATGQVAPTEAADGAPTVLVTGANRGIGLEFVKQYAANGWRVIATARDPASATELQALAKASAAAGGQVAVERLDVADAAEVAALAAGYRGQPIDVLVNNAGLDRRLSRQGAEAGLARLSPKARG